MGRATERAAGRLVELEVGQQLTAGFEMEVVEGAQAIEKLVKQASGG
jgi:copper homeostasis protein CutC